MSNNLKFRPHKSFIFLPIARRKELDPVLQTLVQQREILRVQETYRELINIPLHPHFHDWTSRNSTRRRSIGTVRQADGNFRPPMARRIGHWPPPVRVRVYRSQVFIGVWSTFQAVRVRACGGALRNPNQPRFIGRQPEARVYTERLKASGCQERPCVHLSRAWSIKFRARFVRYNHVFRVSRPL